MTLENGDLVTYPRCFGDEVCKFVGMAEDLEYDNDCVLLYKNKAIPAVLSSVIKIESTED